MIKRTTTSKAARQDSVQEAIIKESDSTEKTAGGVKLPTFLGAELHGVSTPRNVSELFDSIRWFALQSDDEKDRPKLQVWINSHTRFSKRNF